MRTIDRKELQEALASSRRPVLLEALPANYFETEHLPGARNLPLDEIAALAPSVIPSLDSPVVTYCSGPTCQNSKIAAEKLEALGYTNVAAYEGGKEDWSEAGQAFETGSDRKAEGSKVA
jgi:rhodanese-related sulfurtransferase